MENQKVRKLVLSALMAALVYVATSIIQIPSPVNGYVNLGDCFVLLSGWLLGPWYGAAAAGIGSSMYVGTTVKVCVVIYLVLLAALAALTKSGKLNKLLPPQADKLPVYAACGLSALALLASLLGGGISYYAMWALAAVVFALAVYYTVKQL